MGYGPCFSTLAENKNHLGKLKTDAKTSNPHYFKQNLCVEWTWQGITKLPM